MAVGDDANLGTSEGAGNAWKTVDKAMNEVAADDKVWVKASANYTELATIDTAGGKNTPIIFEGYTSSTGDGGRVTVTGGGVRANCIADSLGAGTDIFYIFKNFRFTDATGAGIDTDCDFITFKNCKFDTNGAQGLDCRLVQCEDCEFESNTTSGVEVVAEGGVFVGCTFYSNGTNGIQCVGHLAALFCIFFSNALFNIINTTVDAIITVVNCTIDGDAKNSNTGVYVADQSIVTVVNTVAYDCAVGMGGGGDTGERVISRNNCVNSNTADYDGFNTFSGEVTDAPNFVNEVGGADYTPDTDSPLIDTGFDAGN